MKSDRKLPTPKQVKQKVYKRCPIIAWVFGAFFLFSTVMGFINDWFGIKEKISFLINNKKTIIQSIETLSVDSELSTIINRGQTYSEGDESLLLGTWQGTYVANQGKVGLDLIIYDCDGTDVRAYFYFYPLSAENPNSYSGVYKMEGYLESEDHLILNGKEWIVHPDNYIFLDIDANVDLSNGTIKSDNNSIVLNRISDKTDTMNSEKKIKQFSDIKIDNEVKIEYSTNDSLITSFTSREWDKTNDIGLNGKRYQSGLVFSIGTMWSGMDSSYRDEGTGYLDLFIKNPEVTKSINGYFVLPDTMFSSDCYGTIKIYVNQEEKFNSGKLDKTSTDAIPFDIPLDGNNIVRIEISVSVKGGNFECAWVT